MIDSSMLSRLMVQTGVAFQESGPRLTKELLVLARAVWNEASREGYEKGVAGFHEAVKLERATRRAIVRAAAAMAKESK